MPEQAKHEGTRVDAAAEALRGPLECFFGVSLAPLALRMWAAVALQAADKAMERADG